MATGHLDQIHPGVYLGDYEQATDLKLLQAYGVTHVLNCAIGLSCPYPDALVYKQINLYDDPTQSILPYFQETNE